MAYNSIKNECMIDALQKTATLVGEKKMDNGREVGLGLTLQHDQCMNQAEDIHDGIFRVVVMGAFTTGKSTLINALVGNRILPESTLPSTAILTFIQYGDEDQLVEVHFKDSVNENGQVVHGRTEYMNKEAFLNEYRYTNDDNREFIATGQVARFACVDYAVMRCSLDLMKNGVSIIDSPGLEDKSIATELSLSIARQAHAVIYVCSERGFDDRDRSYITENFLGCPENVFFVMNRADHIKSDAERASAIDKMKDDVKVCFMQSDASTGLSTSSVNYDLLNSRVFSLSALQALDSRRGMTFDSQLQQDRVLTTDERDSLEQQSHFHDFEAALEQFLTTDEMTKAVYGKAFSVMAQTYRDALHSVEESMAFYEGNAQMTEEKRRECERLIMEIEQNIRTTEQAFDNCTLRLQSLYGDLIRDSVRSINKTWYADLPQLQEKINFGMSNYLHLALANINIFASQQEREDNTKRMLEPFAKVIAQHISSKIDEYVTSQQPMVDSVIAECQQQVDSSLQQTSSLFSQLGDTLTDQQEFTIGGDQNWLQNIVSTVAGDASAVVKTAAGGKMQWMEFVSKAVFNFTWQWMIGIMASGGWGVFIIALIEYMQMRNGRNEMVERMLTECKDKTITAIEDKLSSSIETMNQRILATITTVKEEKCRDARQRLTDESCHLQELISNLESNSFNADAERQRTDYILAEILRLSQEAHTTVFGNPISESEFTNIAA